MAALPPGTDISKVPLAPNPNGDPPNFVNPPTKAAVAIAVGLPLAIISVCFVSLRLITNIKIARKLGLDDYLCIFTQIMSTVYLGLAVSCRNTSRHEYDIPLSFLDESWVKRQFALSFIVGPTRWSSKATMLALYIRLFGILRWLRYTCYAGLAISFLFYWVQIPLAGVYCTPRHGGPWDLAVAERCSTLAVMGPVLGAVGLAADLIILIIPLPIIYGLNMPTPKKIGLSIVFLMGIFAIVASTVSIYFHVLEYRGADKFWYDADAWACVVAECYVTIIVSCAPAMSSFWANIFTKSAFYSNFRSSFLFSPSTRLASTKNASPTDLQRQLPYPGSPSHLVHDSNGYYELHDGAYSKPQADISSSGERSSGEMGIITKSTTIDQLWERKGQR